MNGPYGDQTHNLGIIAPCFNQIYVYKPVHPSEGNFNLYVCLFVYTMTKTAKINFRSKICVFSL